ncbi:site-specific integrase [Paenibacillus campi]|uniref:site-specific integrase n=1 Tax=Paenibacillus campi TaxID=3106031 RepID=UPI002AFDFA34|nr:site-specific integrase [Paenibacillus sp. SGZ-1014]
MSNNILLEKTWYKLLYSHVDERLLEIQTQEQEFIWDVIENVNTSSFKYFVKQCIGYAWTNHIALALISFTFRKLAPHSIANMISPVNVRFKELFEHFQLHSMNELNYTHFNQYLDNKILQHHTSSQKRTFVSYYRSIVFNTQKWLKTDLPPEQQAIFKSYLLPDFPFDNRDYKVRTLAIEKAKTKRKEETSAVTPLLPSIRSEAHFRYNQIKRLRTIVQDLLSQLREGKIELPFSFSYKETDLGYAQEEIKLPFFGKNKGVLNQGVFVSLNQHKRSTNTLISIEPLFMACLFAKLTLDLVTSSGARMNEILQISYDKDCCTIVSDESVQRNNYIFRLIPKGREELENYYVPEDIFKSVHEVVGILKEHYNSNTLPNVEYTLRSRKHLFKERKYVFQYMNAHIQEATLSSCLRFLLHGMMIQTNEGRQVVLKTHLLRHAFATHALQNEKLPLDIVKELLHHKDVNTTLYYAAPTNQQISHTIQDMHENWTSFIDIQKEILRSPEELKEMYENYREQVGTMSKVVGGICTIDSVCPTKMACMGCAAKVPLPDSKQETIQYIEWARSSREMFKANELLMEQKKMTLAIRRSENELKEIEMMEKYMEDEKYVPLIQKKDIY